MVLVPVCVSQLSADPLTNQTVAQELLLRLQQIHATPDHCGVGCTSPELLNAVEKRLSVCVTQRRSVYKNADPRTAGLKPCFDFVGGPLRTSGRNVAVLAGVLEPYFIHHAHTAGLGFLVTGRHQMLALAARDADAMAEGVAIASALSEAQAETIAILGLGGLKDAVATIAARDTTAVIKGHAAQALVAAIGKLSGAGLRTPSLDRWQAFVSKGIVIGSAQCGPQRACAVFRPITSTPSESVSVAAFIITDGLTLPLGLTIHQVRFHDDASGGHLELPAPGLIANVREDQTALRESLVLMGLPRLLAERATFGDLSGGMRTIPIVLDLRIAGLTSPATESTTIESLIAAAQGGRLDTAARAFRDVALRHLVRALNSPAFRWSVYGDSVRAAFRVSKNLGDDVRLAANWNLGALGDIDFPIRVTTSSNGTIVLLPGEHIVPPEAIERWLRSVRDPIATKLANAGQAAAVAGNQTSSVVARAKAFANSVNIASVRFDPQSDSYGATVRLDLPAPWNRAFPVSFSPQQALPDIVELVWPDVQRALLAELAARAPISLPADLARKRFNTLGGQVEVLADPPPQIVNGVLSLSLRTTFGANTRTVAQVRIAGHVSGSDLSFTNLDFSAATVEGAGFGDLVADILEANGLAVRDKDALVHTTDVRIVARSVAFRMILHAPSLFDSDVDLGDIRLGDNIPNDFAERLLDPAQRALLDIGEIGSVGPIHNITVDANRTNLILQSQSRKRQIVVNADVEFEEPIRGSLRVRITVGADGTFRVDPVESLESWLSRALGMIVPVVSVDHLISVRVGRVSSNFQYSPLRFDADLDVTLFDAPMPSVRVTVSPKRVTFSALPKLPWPSPFVVAPTLPLSFYAVESSITADIERGALILETHLTCAASVNDAKLTWRGVNLKASLTINFHDVTATVRGDLLLLNHMNVMSMTGTLDIPHGQLSGESQTGDFLRTFVDLRQNFFLDVPSALVTSGGQFSALGLQFKADLTASLRNPPTVKLHGDASILGESVGVDVTAGLPPAAAFTATAGLRMPTILGQELSSGRLVLTPTVVRVSFSVLGSEITLLLPNLNELNEDLLKRIVRERLGKIDFEALLEALRDRNIQISLSGGGKGGTDNGSPGGREGGDSTAPSGGNAAGGTGAGGREGGTGGDSGTGGDGGENSSGVVEPKATTGPNPATDARPEDGKGSKPENPTPAAGGAGDVRTMETGSSYLRITPEGLVTVKDGVPGRPRLLNGETRAHLQRADVTMLSDGVDYMLTTVMNEGSLWRVSFNPPALTSIAHFPRDAWRTLDGRDLFNWLRQCQQSRSCDITQHVWFLTLLSEYEEKAQITDVQLRAAEEQRDTPATLIVTWTGDRAKGAPTDCGGTLYVPGPHVKPKNGNARVMLETDIDLRDERCLAGAPKDHETIPGGWSLSFITIRNGNFSYQEPRFTASTSVPEPKPDPGRWYRARASGDLYASPAIIATLLSPASIASGRRDNVLRLASLHAGGSLTSYIGGDGASQVLNLDGAFLIGPSAKSAIRIAHGADGNIALAECVPRSRAISHSLASILDEVSDEASHDSSILLLQSPQSCSATVLSSVSSKEWMAKGVLESSNGASRVFRVNGKVLADRFGAWAASGMYFDAPPNAGASVPIWLMSAILGPGDSWSSSFKANPLGLLGLSAVK